MTRPTSGTRPRNRLGFWLADLAVVADVAEFRASHKRLKWYILVQNGSGRKSAP